MNANSTTPTGVEGRAHEGGPALVLAAGPIPLPRLVPALLDGVTMIIAADGGLELARTLRLTPDLLVGDMDSVSAAALAAFPAVPRQTHPAVKDELDLELALAAALERGASEVRVLGAFGSRLDQGLAALFIAARHATATAEHGPVPISLHGAHHEAHVLVAGRPRRFALPAGVTVSLLALGADAVVSGAGLAYPLERKVLPFGTGLGVSNAVTGEPGTVTDVKLELHAGAVALMVEHGTKAAAPRAAIWGSQADRIEASLAAADPDLAELVTRVVYDEVFARPGLDLRTRELVSVAVLTALGVEDELTTHLRGALLVGATEQELRETLIHTAIFVGFPRAIQAMRQLQRFLEKRQQG